MLKCFGHQSITVGPEAGALDSGIYAGKNIQEALITVEDAPVRITVHTGSAPDDATKLGHLFGPGAVFRVEGPSVDNLRYIQSGATAGHINVSYFNNA